MFYAYTPGAFVDLAADAMADRPNPGAVVLDVHLDDPDGARPVSGSAGWSETAVVNQATGVLLGRGYTPGQARGALHTRRVGTGIDVMGTARAVVASTVKGPADSRPPGA